MRRSNTILCLALGSLLAACGGGSDGASEVPVPGVSGMLRPVANAAELETSIKNAMRDAPPANGLPTVPTVTASGFSNTNTVEAGIDEADHVRYDGTHLFIAAADYSAVNTIRIVRTNPSNATATQVATIPLPQGDFVQGMYVANARLTVVSSEAHFMTWGALWASTLIWAPSDVSIRVYDVSNPALPTQVMSARFDGVFVASRRIDDRVYLVSRHTPAAMADPAARARVDSLALAELLPALTLDGVARPLIEPARCFITNTTGRHSNALLTTITMFSLSNPRDLSSTCYNESADGVYVSATAMYVSQPHHPTGTSHSTRIHKFALGASGPNYAGSVEVEGAVWAGGQNDFRMSEHDGNLRVLTTEWMPDPADSFDHRLFVLRQKAAEPALEIVGRLPNNLRPAEIGKPNEQLFGVRFTGERAYAITFLRIDPLYVFDLANPADPRIAGQLELPGVSDYLHPVSQDLLLGLGRDGSRVKLELFDVSVLENPQSRGTVFAPGPISLSEATWDRHAFTYLPADAADRVAIPVTSYDSVPPHDSNGASLLQLEIAGKQVPSSAQLRDAGSVIPPFGSEIERFADRSRSFIHGDTVFYVRRGAVWASNWSTPAQVNGPF
jgi:hypothetical protein